MEMTRNSTIDRLGALMGLVFVGLLVTFRVIEASPGLPDADAHTADVVAFWTQHRGQQILVAILASFAAIVFLWFAGTLRSALARAEGGEATLANLSFGGAIVAATGMLAISTVEYAAAHSAGHVPATVTQTLSALQADTWLGFAAGVAVFGLATGAAVLRTRALPRWLGWVSVASGLLWLTPAQPVGLLLTLVLLAGAGIGLYRRPALEPALA
jgi:hypothetical protein